MSRRLRLPAFYILFLLLAAAGSSFAQTADFTFSPVSGCAPLVVQFTDLSSGVISNYNWNLGNGATPTLRNPSTSYLSPGTYVVTLTATGPGGSDTKTDTIHVYGKPAVSFAAATPVAGCAPHNVQFSTNVTPNSPGTVTYNWDFGDGNTGTGVNPAHSYATPGIYTVLLTVINGAGCDSTAVRNAYITAWPVPVANFSASQTFFCGIPATVSFSSSSTGGTTPYTIGWTFGDGGIGAGGSISHVYNAGGGFTVKMVTTDPHGCADSMVKPAYIMVNATPATFSGPLSVCIGVETSFVNTTPGSSGTSWNFGDGHTNTGSSGTNSYNTAGSYTVSMTTSFGGCTKTVTKTLIVSPRPAATITMSPAVPCPAPVTVGFTGSSTYATSYKWKWDNGDTAIGQTVSELYVANRLGFEQSNVKLITTSAAGCLDSVSMQVLIRDLHVHVLPGGYCTDGPSGCFPLRIPFSVNLLSNLPLSFPTPSCPVNVYPASINSWTWDFDDGTTGTGATPVHVFNPAGTYKVRCIITTTNGCSDTGYRYVHADTMVHASFTASPRSVCAHAPVVFVNTTVNPLVDTKYEFYIRDFYIPKIDTSIVREDTLQVTDMMKAPGRYTVILYTDHRGCHDTATQIDYIIVNPPGADFVDSIYCSPSTTVKFLNSSISPTSQHWDFGDGDTSAALNPIHTYPGMGSYFPKLTVYNSAYGCKDTLVKRIQLFIPSFDFTVTDSTICTDEFVEFQATFFGYGRHAFSWILDGGSSPFDSVGTLDYRFATYGYHDVTLLLASGFNRACIDTLFKPARILVAQPQVIFKPYPPIGCMPLNVQFRDSSINAPGVHNASRFWAFGDGDTATSSQAVINHIYTNRGSDTVHLVVTDSLGCVSDLLTGYAFVSVHKPTAAFTANDSSVCARDRVVFTDTTAGAVAILHQWSFGDGDTATGNPITHRYRDTGLFTVRLIVTDTVGCTDTLTRNNYISVDAPQAAFTMSDSLAICPPLLIRFSNQSGGATTYLWDFGTGGAPVVVTNPVNTYNAAGLFHVSLVATNANGCTDTARATVRVLGYGGAFTYSPLTGCAPMQVSFSTSLTSVPQITWDFNDGITSTSTSNSATHIYTAPGAYIPKAIFSDGHGCTSSSAGLDTIKVDKVSAGFHWSIPCAGAAFSLFDSSTALYNNPVSWAWHFGGRDTAAGQSVSYTFPSPGNHGVTLIATNATGCKDTITRDVFINYLPLVKAPEDTPICPGDMARLVAKGALRYSWSPAPDSLANCPACDTAFVRIAGPSVVYIVTGTDSNGCMNKDSVRVIIQIKTTSSIGAGGEICLGESFRLHAEGAQRYEWIPAATLDSPLIASPLATPQTTTTYIVAAQEGTCLVDSQHVRVVVHSLPLFSAGEDEIISLGSAVTLKPTQSGITRIEWRADTTLSCADCFRPNAHPLYTTTYYATGYNEFGCAVTDSVTVHVRCNGSLVYIPNTFTPNGDGLNDYFFPRGKGIDRMSSFRIFNRWGELIFERSNVALNDEHAGWDGSYKGKALPPDTYVYTMQSRCETGEPLSWKGDVTLIR